MYEPTPKTRPEWAALLESIKLLKEAVLAENPPPALKFAAAYLLNEYRRVNLPDWVAALAAGNTELWNDVIEVVRAEIKEDEV